MSSVTLAGIDDVRAQLRALGRDAGKAARTAARSVARSVVDEARASAPVDTGALRRSIGQREMRGGIMIAGVRAGEYRGRGGRIKRPEQYAFIVNKRTQFFTSACERARAAAPGRYLRALREAIQRIASTRRN